MEPTCRVRQKLTHIVLGAIFLLQLPPLAKADGRLDYALFGAIRRGDVALLKSHLREGAPVNVRASDGTTPLMLAALFGTTDTLRLLLDAGADPNATNQAGAGALLFAAGDRGKVELLIDRGAQVNARSTLGNTPLIAAASYPDNLEVVKLLLDKGADLHAKNENNVSVLAAAVLADDARIAAFLIERGCKPADVTNLFGAAGRSLLSIAAGNGNQQIVEMLLAQGVDVNSSDTNFAGSALNNALLSQRPEIARRLIEAGADVKSASPIGKVPPILLAAYSETGDASVARLLLARGADPGAINQAAESALTWARRRGFHEVIEVLEKAGTHEPDSLRIDVKCRDVKLEADSRAALVRSAIEKSLALMTRTSDVFLENRRSCVSCHHQNLPGVALGWARDRGFEVSAESIQRMIDRQRDSWSRRIEAAYEMDNPFPVPPQFLGYGLWSVAALGQAPDTLSDAVVWYLAATQRPDGRWTPGGVTRPPMGGDDILSTTLAMRALQLYRLDSRRAEFDDRVEKARRWLADAKPLNTQERVFKLLGLAWAGTPVSELGDELEALRAAQRADGGWPQLPGLASDAWATGQALVALRVAGGVPREDEAFRRGLEYLLGTQFDDGSWYVESRAWPFQPTFDSGFPFGRDQWISAGATAWATMALLLDVEPTKPSLVPARTDPAPQVTAAASSPPAVPEGAERRTEPVDFVREIKPILERSCAGCHSGEKPEGGFRVTAREDILRGGESGELAIVAGRSGESPLFARVTSDNPDLAMPPLAKRDKFPPLSKDERQAIRAWIDSGASWPAEATVTPPAE